LFTHNGQEVRHNGEKFVKAKDLSWLWALHVSNRGRFLISHNRSVDARVCFYFSSLKILIKNAMDFSEEQREGEISLQSALHPSMQYPSR